MLRLCILLGLPQDKKTAADMYEKAALLGERGAEEEAKRLRKEIHKLGICNTLDHCKISSIKLENVKY